MDGKLWYYSVDGVEKTAVSEDVLRSMLESGALSGDILVWTEGLANWARAHSIAALKTAPAPSQRSSYSPSYSARPRGGGGSAFLSYAGFWKRFVAVFIDGIILQILYFFVAIAYGVVWGMSQTMDGGTMAADDLEKLGSSPVLFLLNILVAWIYFATLESSSSQATLGKRAMKIIVTDLDGDPISFGRASLRVFGKFLSTLTFCIGYLMAAFTGQKQALHDFVASTLVVDR